MSAGWDTIDRMRRLPVRCALAACALAACAEVDSPNPEMVLPERYRESFVETRGCRSSVEHDLSYVVIRLSPEAAAVYDQGPYPFAAGALVVKEQYADARCMSLTGWTVMRKEAAGSEPSAGDWRWYKLDRRQRVLEQGKPPRCVGCHAGCKERDWTCADPEP